MSTTIMPMNLEEILDGIRFPTAKTQIVTYADENGASEEALEILRAIPARDYRNMQEINAKLGMIEDQPGSENLWSSSRSKA